MLSLSISTHILVNTLNQNVQFLNDIVQILVI